MADFSILFVCMGNICRSPAAEGVFRHRVEEAGLAERVFIDSAGTIAYHEGNPADSRMRAAAGRRGIELKSIARKIVPEDLERFDLIVTMDQENYENVLALDTQGRFAEKVKPFTEYCMAHADKEVPDPYYGGDGGFEHVLNLLDDGCTELLEIVRRKLS